MDWHQDHSRKSIGATLRSIMCLAALARLVSGSATAMAQQPVAATALVFDGVTVIDVERGNHIPAQRVVVVGNRIKTMGEISKVSIPAGARVVDAKGKYLIPGLWDMHTHPRRYTDLFYPLFIANGVTGIRDAGSEVPINTLQKLRREILDGTRVGPPRQLLSGQSIAGPHPGCQRSEMNDSPQTCIADSADAVHYVDSLKALGADMIKPRAVSKAMYFVIAAESRRLGIPFGGHAEGSDYAEAGQWVTALEASNHGASIVDHELGERACWKEEGKWDSTAYRNSLAQCQEDAKQFSRNGTWLVPTLVRTPVLRGPAANAVFARFAKRVAEFWGGVLLHGNWLRDSSHAETPAGMGSSVAPGVIGAMSITQRAAVPLMAGTDAGAPVLRSISPGFSLQAELAMNVAEGVTPLNVLQSATLNPAKFLHATDSLGTVAPGKLADLLLLDEDPLVDITNVTTIRAVVANGRYFDRAALDQLLTEVQAQAKRNP